MRFLRENKVYTRRLNGLCLIPWNWWKIICICPSHLGWPTPAHKPSVVAVQNQSQSPFSSCHVPANPLNSCPLLPSSLTLLRMPCWPRLSLVLPIMLLPQGLGPSFPLPGAFYFSSDPGKWRIGLRPVKDHTSAPMSLSTMLHWLHTLTSVCEHQQWVVWQPSVW